MSRSYLIPPEATRTDRLLIRSYLPGDGAALSAAVEASYEHLRPWMPWAQPAQPVSLSEELARTFRARWLLAEDFTLGLWSPDGTRLLGGSGFHLRHGPLSLGIAEIGMWIRADSAGSGLGSHALAALIGWGFSAWPWRRLVWRCDTHNLASQRVAEKCGLTLEGITRQDRRSTDGLLRDTAHYAILRPEIGKND